MAYDSTNHVAVFIGSPITESNPSMVLNVSGYSQTAETSWASMPNMSYSQVNYAGTCYFSFKNTSFTEATAYEFLSKLQVEYQLVNSYTDNSIENQSILPLDSNMANKIRQKVVDGLQLFDFAQIGGSVYTSTTPHNVSISIDKSAKTVSATATGTYSRCIIKLADYLVANETYTFAFTLTGSAVIVGLSNTGTHIDNTEYGNIRDKSAGTYSITFTATTNVLYLVLYVTTSLSSGSVTLSNIMITDTTHPYPYSDFNQKEHITNAQAELLKSEEDKSNGNTYTTTYQGVWNVDGTSSDSANNRIRSAKIAVESGKTYKVSYNASSGVVISSIIWDSTGATKVGDSAYTDGSFILGIPSNGKYLAFNFKRSSGASISPGAVTSFSFNDGEIVHEVDRPKLYRHFVKLYFGDSDYSYVGEVTYPKATALTFDDLKNLYSSEAKQLQLYPCDPNIEDCIGNTPTNVTSGYGAKITSAYFLYVSNSQWTNQVITCVMKVENSKLVAEERNYYVNMTGSVLTWKVVISDDVEEM